MIGRIAVIRAMRNSTARRGRTVAVQVREIGSGAAQRQAREKLPDAARRRDFDVIRLRLGVAPSPICSQHCKNSNILASVLFF